MDILYLGVNMGNDHKRFFCRYPEAKQDYYDGFRWLIKLKQTYPYLDIAIKHHGGNYDSFRDKQEVLLMANTGIRYIDNHMDSYTIALQSRVCVSYCSTMVLELNGYSNMARYLYRQRHHHCYMNLPCRGHKDIQHYQMPAYYLDPGHRNRQFCRYIDDVYSIDCNRCIDPPYLEVFEPYRLCSYEQFADTMRREVDDDKLLDRE